MGVNRAQISRSIDSRSLSVGAKDVSEPPVRQHEVTSGVDGAQGVRAAHSTCESGELTREDPEEGRGCPLSWTRWRER